MDRPADKAKKALGLSMFKRHDIDAFVRQYGVEPGDAIWAALCRLDSLEIDNKDLMNDYQSLLQDFANLNDDYDNIEQEVQDLREEKRRRE